MSDRVKVVVTGAAGQISYSLIPRLVDGTVFGNKKVDLELVEIPAVLNKLEGMVMEMEDSFFPYMGDINITDNFADAAENANWFLLVGSIPRGIVLNGKKIEERSDLLKVNGGIFIDQGKAIGEKGKEKAKILVVGNPANTNALIGHHHARNETQLWMAMTMLDSNRAKSFLAKKASVGVDEVTKMTIWGNHSPTMYPDFENVLIGNQRGADVFSDLHWIENEFIPGVQQRGKAVIDARGASSATSAAKAALDTVRAVEHKTIDGDCFSAAIVSDGSYGIDEGLVAGVPLISDGQGQVNLIRDFSLSDFAKQRIQISIEELKSEKEAVADLLD